MFTFFLNVVYYFVFYLTLFTVYSFIYKENNLNKFFTIRKILFLKALQTTILKM